MPPMAILRHATSQNLEGGGPYWISIPLGFRGEALPSISSVSRFTMQTREAGQSFGHRGEDQRRQGAGNR